MISQMLEIDPKSQKNFKKAGKVIVVKPKPKVKIGHKVVSNPQQKKSNNSQNQG